MIEKDLGFILKRYNFRETSVIASIYTRRYGKISGILKGFYSGKREFTSPLDIGSLNEFVFYPKQSQIWLISYVDLVKEYPFLKHDRAKTRVALTLVDIVDRTMQVWDTNAAVFALLNDCLQLIPSEIEQKILYIFLIKFLTLSGFRPELNRCLHCHDDFKHTIYFSVAKGGLLCARCQSTARDAKKMSPETSSSFRYIQNQPLAAIMRLKLNEGCQKELLYILREFLCYHLEYDILPCIQIPK